MKIAIVEDDRQDQERLQEYFEKFSQSEQIPCSLSFFSNGDDFLEEFTSDEYSLVLMDIELNSRLNGIDTSVQLRKIDSDVLLVFMTNLAQYAIEGYKVKAFDYIVKPISYPDFYQRMKVIAKQAEENQNEKILISFNDKKEIVYLKDIYYVEVKNHTLLFHTSTGEKKAAGTLKKLLEKFSSSHFSLCNSCYLVNLAYVESVYQFDLVVHGVKLSMSHAKRRIFLEELNRYLGQ